MTGRSATGIVAAAASAALVACGDDGTRPGASTEAPGPAPRPQAADPALCDVRRGTRVARIDAPELAEISGLAVGRRAPGLLLAIADSGAAPVLTVLRRSGAVVGRLTVPGAGNTDWEDLAVGPGPDGASAAFAADIGDNEEARATVTVYRVPEPTATQARTVPATPAAAALALRYPDGAHDAEALLVDPVRGDLVVVTKALLGGRAYVLPAGSRSAPGPVRTLRRGPAVALGPVTAGDVSADGRIVALRSYGTLAVWRRRGREPLTATLARSPACRRAGLLAAEGQGESLALTRDGRAAFTAPEEDRPLLRRYGQSP